MPDEYLGLLASQIADLMPSAAQTLPIYSQPTIPAGLMQGAAPQIFQATLQVNVTAAHGTPEANYQAAYQGGMQGGQEALDAFRRGGIQQQIAGARQG